MSTTSSKTTGSIQPVRVGVVGAGQMGAHHLRIYGGVKGVELVGVVDAEPARAQLAAARYRCRVFASVARTGLRDGLERTYSWHRSVLAA